MDGNTHNRTFPFLDCLKSGLEFAARFKGDPTPVKRVLIGSVFMWPEACWRDGRPQSVQQI